MGINRVKKRGKIRLEVRNCWPDGTTYRRYFPTYESARQQLLEIELAILKGQWRKLKRQLQGGEPEKKDLTVSQFAAIYMEDYVKPRCRSWDRYEMTVNQFCERYGKVPLNEFSRRQLHGWVKRRARRMTPGSVNRDTAVIKAMFRQAFEWGYLEHHPLAHFPLLPVRRKARPRLTVSEFRKLVDSIPQKTMAAYVAILGEMGMRKQEGLHLKWADIDFSEKVVTVQRTKTISLATSPCLHMRWAGFCS